MRSHNAVWTSKTITINDFNLPNELPSLKQPPEVIGTRKTLLILIGVLLIFWFMDLVFTVYIYATNDSPKDQSLNSSSQLVSLFLSIVYYGFGFLVTYRYYRTGLLVFAWLGFLSLLIYAVLIVIALILVTTILNAGVGQTIGIVIVTIIVFLIASLLQGFIVRYAFLLSKLLKHTKPLTIEQM